MREYLESILDRLRELLEENLARLPPTDLYLTHPLLESPEYSREFRRVILGFLEGRPAVLGVRGLRSTLSSSIRADKRAIERADGERSLARLFAED